MKAILIDPVKREVRAVEHDNSSYKNIAEAIHAELFTLVRINEVDSVFVDDEGRINGRGEVLGGFRLHGDNRRMYVDLAGYGLVLGSDEEGDAADTTLDAGDVRGRIEWLEGRWFAANPPPPMEIIPLPESLTPGAVADLLHAERVLAEGGESDEDAFYRNLLGPGS